MKDRKSKTRVKSVHTGKLRKINQQCGGKECTLNCLVTAQPWKFTWGYFSRMKPSRYTETSKCHNPNYRTFTHTQTREPQNAYGNTNYGKTTQDFKNVRIKINL